MHLPPTHTLLVGRARRYVAWRGFLCALTWMLLVAWVLLVGVACAPALPPQGAPRSQTELPFGEPEVVVDAAPASPLQPAPADVRNEPAPVAAEAAAEPNSASTLEAELAIVGDDLVVTIPAATALTPAPAGETSVTTPVPHSTPAPATGPAPVELPHLYRGVLGAATLHLASIPPSHVPDAPAPGESAATSAALTEPPGDEPAAAEPSAPAQVAAEAATPVEAGTDSASAEPAVDAPAPASVAESAPTWSPSAGAIQPTPDGTRRTAHVPILMYHYLSEPPPAADIYRQDLSVAPDLFAAHLDRLRAEGYTAISLYDLILNLTQGAPLPEKPVVITFDDGYRDNYENALPRLRERGMTATFFVVTDFIDEQRPEYLTWEMAREMLAAGMSIESHGRNHVTLYGKDDDYLIWQALGSLQTIEYELGVRPRFVSYPAGEYDQRTLDIFNSAGYWAGVTTEQGATHDSDQLLELTRVRVRGSTSPDDLARLLAMEW